MAILPPGVSSRNFSRTLQRFEDVVGKDWVFSSDEDVDLYRDAYSVVWDEEDERRASAAVAPASVEEVQAIVRIANEFKVPLYPISTGKNLTYGGSAPNMTGTVVLDLKRMNQILEVDDKRHFALVEPGVSYFDLYKHIRENQLKVWIDCPDPGWGSVMGNSLDRGVGYTTWPFRDHFGAHCGMEVVLPDGELMRTGMGAVPGSDSWQEYKYGFGPWVDGLFGQGNFGVVTKMGYWLMPEPQAYLRAYVTVPHRRDLIPLVDEVSYLENLSYIGQQVYSSPLGRNMSSAPLSDLLAKDPFPPDEALDRVADEMGIPYWQCELQFYGSAEGVLANWRHAQERMKEAMPNAGFREGEYYKFPLTSEQIENEHHKVAFGIPNLAIWDVYTRNDAHPEPDDGHLDFSCVIPRSGETFLKAQRVFHEGMQREGGINLSRGIFLSPFQAPFSWHPRNFIYFVPFPTSRRDKAVNRRTRELMSLAIELSAENGWAEYRTAPAFQDQLMGIYSFNDNILRKFCEALKDGVDPNGIISPGRGGVWPERFRSQRSIKS